MGLMSEQELIQKRQKWDGGWEVGGTHFRLRVHNMVKNNENGKDCSISNILVTV